MALLPRGLENMQLTTHLDFLRVLVATNQEDTHELSSYHTRAALQAIAGDKVARALNSDHSGKVAKEILLMAAAHLLLAADKIEAEQEQSLAYQRGVKP